MGCKKRENVDEEEKWLHTCYPACSRRAYHYKGFGQERGSITSRMEHRPCERESERDQMESAIVIRVAI